MSDRLLVLDQSAEVTGFADWKLGTSPLLGTNRLPKTGFLAGKTLWLFEQWLDDMRALCHPTIVVYEAPWAGPKTSRDTAFKLITIAGLIEYWCYKNDIRCLKAEVGDWRQHFIGSRNQNRKTAQDWTREECEARGIEFRKQDEADVFGILDYAAFKLGLEPDWPVGRHRGTLNDFRNRRAS